MKKVLLILVGILIVVPLLTIVGFKLSWGALVEPKIKDQLVSQAEAQGYKLKVEQVALKSWFLPVKVEIKNLHVYNKDLSHNIKIPSVMSIVSPRGLGFSLNALAPAIEVHVFNPAIVYKMIPPSDEKKGEGGEGASSGGFVPPPISLQIEIFQGDIQIGFSEKRTFGLRDLKSSVFLPDLRGKQVGLFKLTTGLAYKVSDIPVPLEGQVPLEITSNKLLISSSGSQIPDLNINMGGMHAQVEFKQSPQELFVKTLAKGKDLKDLQKGGLLPDGKWSGSWDLEFDLLKKGEMDPKVHGNFKFNKIRGVLAKPIKKEDSQIAGGFVLNGKVDFEHQSRLKKLEGDLSGDFTSLAIYRKKLFYKPKKMPLRFVLSSGIKGDKVEIKKADLLLNNIKAHVGGMVDPNAGGISSLQVELKKADLEGVEKIILPLKKYPATGHLAFQTQIRGDLQNPKTLQVKVNPLELNIRSGIRYQDPETKNFIAGPFSMKATGRLSMNAMDLKSAEIKGNAQLSKLKIKWGEFLRKTSKQKLSLIFDGKNVDREFTISNFKGETFLGNFSLKGNVKDALKPKLDPKLNLSGTISKINLKKVKGLIKAMKPYPVDGYLAGQFQVSGAWKKKAGLESSPLNIKGVLKHQARKLIWKSPDKKKSLKSGKSDQSQASAKSQAPQPLLPNWPVAKNMVLSFESRIGDVEFDGLKGKNFFFKGNINNGRLTGETRFDRLMSGKVKVSKLSANLLEVPMFISGVAKTQGLNLKSAITWGMPAHKDMVKGFLTGGFKFKTPFPGHGDTLAQSESSGRLTIKGFELSTLKLDAMINDLMSKIPGLKGKKKVKTEKVVALFKSRYTFKGGTLYYRDTDFLTPENHQLKADGEVRMDKSLKLKGKMFVSDVEVGNDVKACLMDKMGRLEVPVEYDGLITSPKMSYASKAIKAVGKKYAKCESKKHLKKVETKAKKEADKLLKKEGKKLEESLKGKFKDIF